MTAYFGGEPRRESEAYKIGGIGRTPLVQVLVKEKIEDQFIDKKVIPYIVGVNAHKPYPQANLVFDNLVHNFDIGLELHDYKYSFDENMKLFQGQMKTASGLYLPLSLSNYVTPSNFPIMSLEGAPDKAPLYFVYSNGKEDSVLGFIIKEGYLVCFNGINRIDKKDSFHNFISLSNSMLGDRIQIYKGNLEKKVHEESKKIEVAEWKNPKDIVNYLDRFVVEQDEAKKVLAIGWAKYNARINAGDDTIEKGNVLLIGPSGTGKSYLASLLARGQNLPTVSVKATGKSQTGYVGENLSSAIFSQLLASMKIKEFEEGKIYEPKGVIFIDEIDKLCRGEISSSVSHKLQQEIVGWAEEDVVSVELNPHKTALISTKNLLFIAAGAFGKIDGREDSLYSIAEKRKNPNKTRIGFNPTEIPVDSSPFITEEDLEKYGLMPELIGRFTGRAVLHPLSLEALAKIFSSVENSTYSSYKKIFKSLDYNLEMEDEIPHIIAEQCSKETGARAIKSISSKLFDEIIYSPEKFAQRKTIRLTPSLVENILNAKMEKPKTEIRIHSSHLLA